MSSPWNDIRQLADLIAAEAEGRAIDRDRAGRLAAALAERHPEIRASLGLILDRMRGTGGPRADAA